MSIAHVEKLKLLETFKNKLRHARRHSYAAMAEILTAKKVQTDDFLALYSRRYTYYIIGWCLPGLSDHNAVATVR